MTYTVFLAGATMATFAAAAVFFLKLWLTAQSRFFAFFAMACGLLAIERIVALFVTGALGDANILLPEASSWIYLIRLCAFTMILVAIISKNLYRK